MTAFAALMWLAFSAAPAHAQQCVEDERVVLCATDPAIDVAGIAALVALEPNARGAPLRATIAAAPNGLEIAIDGGAHIVVDGPDADSQRRAAALAIAEALEVEAAPAPATPATPAAQPRSPAELATPWRDPRPLATPEDRDLWLPYARWEDRAVFPAGATFVTTRARVVPTLDHRGIAASLDCDVRLALPGGFWLGAELSPGYLVIGDGIEGGRYGLGAAVRASIDLDWIAFGAIAGVASLARTGTPVAGLLGISLRLGLVDWAHGEIDVAIGRSGDTGWVPAYVRAEILGAASDQVELLLRARGEWELGSIGFELGARWFPDGDRIGTTGFELGVGLAAYTFRQRCEFVDCPSLDATWGPSLVFALHQRFE